MTSNQSTYGAGSFRATTTWNYIVRSFQRGVAAKTFRYRMKVYKNCFPGTNATQWLRDFFEQSGEFGVVSSVQVERLCQKLLDAAVFVNACETSTDLKKFQNSGHPYRMVKDSQACVKRGPSPLADISNSCSSSGRSKCKRKSSCVLAVPNQQFCLQPLSQLSLYNDDELPESSGNDHIRKNPLTSVTQCGEKVAFKMPTSTARVNGENAVLANVSNVAEALGKVPSRGTRNSRKANDIQARKEKSAENVHVSRSSSLCNSSSRTKLSRGGIRRSLRNLQNRHASKSSEGMSPKNSPPALSGSLHEQRREQPVRSQLSKGEEADIWKEVAMSSLFQLIDLPILEGILHSVSVDGAHIASNCGCDLFSVMKFVPIEKVVSASSSRSASPEWPCSWTSVHERCNDHYADSNIAFPSIVCSAMDLLANFPRRDIPICHDGWINNGGLEISWMSSVTTYFNMIAHTSLVSEDLIELFMGIIQLLESEKFSLAENALQFCLLLLPPTNRCLLQRLLSFMDAVGNNENISLSSSRTNAQMLRERFLPVIFNSACMESLPAEATQKIDGLLAFMVQSHWRAFFIPSRFLSSVQYRLAEAAAENDFRSPISDSCDTVPSDFDTHTKQALLDLLTFLATREDISARKKYKQLQQFKKAHPNIYALRYPENAQPTIIKRRSSVLRWSAF